MATTLDILTALAEGRMTVADAQSAIVKAKEIAQWEADRKETALRRWNSAQASKARRVHAAVLTRTAIASRGLPGSPIRPRPVAPIVSDRAVVSAFAHNEVSKAQTSAMNCFVLEL